MGSLVVAGWCAFCWLLTWGLYLGLAWYESKRILQ